MNSSAASVAEQVDRLLDAASPAVKLDDDGLRAGSSSASGPCAMLQAAQADAMVQMGVRARAADRAEVTGRGEPMWSRECRAEFVPDEIGVLLGWTKTAAASTVRDRAPRRRAARAG